MKRVIIEYYDDVRGHNSKHETVDESEEEAVRLFKKVFDYEILQTFVKEV